MADYIPWWEQLKDPRWQQLRLKVMERDGFQCQECGDKTETLNVHHKRYVKGRKAWEYEADDLVTLCETCHESRHTADEALKDALAKSDDSGYTLRAVGYVRALHALYSCTTTTLDDAEEVQGAADAIGIPFWLLDSVRALSGSQGPFTISGISLCTIEAMYRIISAGGDERKMWKQILLNIQTLGGRFTE
jgi:hypothetical protein